MFFLKPNKAQLLRQPSLEILFCIFVFFATAYLLFHGYLYKLAFIVLLVSCIYVAFSFPLFTVFLLIILAVLPTIFQMVPGYSEKWMSIGFGIRIQDAVLVSMLGAVILKVIFRVKELSARNNLSLSVYVILFSFWILFEIIRNINVYGLSAPGEFRYRYLILCVPLYLALFISSEERRKKLFKILLVSSLFFPIICVPIIGQLNGWAIGPKARFFPSSISLGLLYGLLALGLSKKYKIIKIREILYWLIIVNAILIIVIDSHRSVWITAIATGATLFWIKEIKLRKIMNNAFSVTFFIIIILFLAHQLIMLNLKTNLTDFTITRTNDLIKIDEKYNNTASWRVAQWRAQIPKFCASPIIGQGFGGYWGFSGVQGDLGVSPHNLYIQTLVKLGSVGMILYLIIVIKVFFKLKRTITNYKFMDDSEMPILILGMVVLIASHVFYIAYSFDYYSLLFVGLGLSSLQDKRISTDV